MLNNPHRCVIDRDGYYVTFVNLDHIPKSFALTDGQSYIEASPPSNMITARWISGIWTETASPEQIAAAETARAQESVAAGPDWQTNIELALAELAEVVLGG